MPTIMRHNLRAFILVAVLVVSVFGFGLHAAHAQDAAPAIFSEIGLNNAEKMDGLINAGNYITQGTDAPNYAWIYAGWTVVRQMSNILVLLFLFIASAATTLNLQIGTYGIKRMLPTIITGTILANMSRELTEIFLSVQHAISNGFISMSGGATANGLWGNLAAPVRTALQSVQPTSTIGGVVGGFIYLIMATVGVLALLLLLILFWVRKIILGFLIILAPLAFLSMAAPFSQGMFRKWWGEYVKWMFMPAVSAFFISVGGIIVASIMGTTGAFSFIAFLAALLSIYLAVKTPFMMGGLVGAAAGFIAGNTWGKVKAPLMSSVKENAEILAHRTPGVGNALRMLQTAPKRRKTALEGMRKRPVIASSRARDERILLHGSASEQARAARRLANRLLQFRNWAAENYEVSMLAAEKVGRRAENSGKWTRAGALERRRGWGLGGSEADDMARDKVETELADIEAERVQLEAEDEYRQNNPGLNLALAASQEEVAGLKDKLEGLANTFKAVALNTDEHVRALRRQATLMKELGTNGYGEQMAAIKKEIRETRNDASYEGSITQQLEEDPELQRQLELLVGRDFGDRGSVMKSALVRLGGSKKMLEGTIESIEKNEQTLFSNSTVSGISTLHQSLEDLQATPTATRFRLNNGINFDQLIDHDFQNTTDGRNRFNQAMGDAFNHMGARGQAVLDELGISHLSQEEQMDYLFDFLSRGNKEMRGVAMVNGAKVLGETESGQRTWITKDATLDTIAGTLRANLSSGKIGDGLALRDAGGLYTQTGVRVYQGFGATHRERQEGLHSRNKAVAQVHAAIEKIMSLQDTSDMQEVFGDGATLGEVGQVLNDIGMARGASDLTDANLRLRIGQNDVTLQEAMARLRGDPGAPQIIGANGGELKENEIRKAIATAVKNHLADAVHLRESIADNAWSAAAA